MNGIEAIAAILKTEGVDWLACYPSNPLIEAAAQVGIRPINFRHERGAVMAADGYSRTSGRQRFGVVAVQSQAGAENAMGGIAQAYADNVPILVLPGGVNLDQLAVKPNFSASNNYQGVVKRVEAIYRPDQVSSVMRRAFHALRNGPPGPVVVEMLTDVCDQEVPGSSFDYRPPQMMKQVPAQAEIDEAVKELLRAEKPVIWAGGGVLLAGATAALRELAELTGIPVFCTMPGKSALDERHPLCLGAGSRATTLPAHRWLQECDLLLAIGSSLTRGPYCQIILPGKVIIQNSIDADDINKDESIDIGLVGDAKLTLEAMIETVRREVGNGRAARGRQTAKEIAACRKPWLDQWMPLLTSDEEPLNTYRVIHDIDRTLDWENSIVTHDAGAPRDSIVPFYTATVPNSYIGWGKTTHLGFGLPLMIGAKLAHPEKFCLNLMGDGAFGMSGLDLETAVRAKAPITTVLLNNGGMATYPPGNFSTARERFGVSHMVGDYAKIAEGLGAVGITVTKTAEMIPAMRRAQRLNTDGQTVLIDVHSNLESRRSRWDR
ncbi:MAG: thiamine pyrophosphate-requiring protein [Caldilineaceae bacterium SB0668_bin_21]|nr:thiamine pyrophosphate-requiring protein [Caldilineaceae bacterium SB0668_bin_21]MYC22189.1 thiamine pyrophosphate-requiring protein [Caldilineaceae bacterium SB0662_bin_25]